ncbi:hypothetical protein PMI16_02626 [Herbaspirillum sp. CF444]|nr:hypothetical protein [Herbaspirillum sp. CF444]EJL87740.1 hypothetical protein PMI16_02626 [Herbaspirillum sp. CF444]
MKHPRRLLAIFAFVAGGLAAELARPVYCSLLNVTSTASARRRKRV